jgi:hypothetical protein
MLKFLERPAIKAVCRTIASADVMAITKWSISDSEKCPDWVGACRGICGVECGCRLWRARRFGSVSLRASGSALNARCPSSAHWRAGLGPGLDHVYSAAITPIASVQREPAFFGLRHAPISAPSTARSFHAWPNGLPHIRPLLSDRLAAALASS